MNHFLIFEESRSISALSEYTNQYAVLRNGESKLGYRVEVEKNPAPVKSPESPSDC